ncbi:MAG: glutamate 5-kinase [SAR324 cluster bacterium]|nr:glutamate 5-kinase [SAR324 cluster bacterium]
MKKQRIVIKVGTNVLQSENGKLDYNLIRDLAEQISNISEKGYQTVFVSSGAVGAGRELISFHEEKNQILQGQMMAAVGQVRLMQIYSDFFLEHQIVIAQVLVTRTDFGERVSYLNIRNTLDGLLDAGVVPIINENDVVATDELSPQFGDNDKLAVFISALVGADALFFLTIAPGLLTGLQPHVSQKSQLIDTVTKLNDEILNYCEPSTSSGGKGGMASKVQAAGMAMSFGIDAYIVAGKMDNVVLRILEGDKLGTHFVAQGEKVNSYRKWLAAGAQSKGSVSIDKGAENALYNKKSLLAAGITKVHGNFEAKDLVTIYNQSHIKIGTGRIQIAARDLKNQVAEYQKSRADSNRSQQITSKAVVSRDYLFLIEPSSSQ